MLFIKLGIRCTHNLTKSNLHNQLEFERSANGQHLPTYLSKSSKATSINKHYIKKHHPYPLRWARWFKWISIYLDNESYFDGLSPAVATNLPTEKKTSPLQGPQGAHMNSLWVLKFLQLPQHSAINATRNKEQDHLFSRINELESTSIRIILH